MLRRTSPVALMLYIAFVFIQSLFFKFTDSPETQYIFGTLEDWGASLGWPGLFAHDGIFSQYVVGTGELIASTLLLGLTRRCRILRPVGALMAIGVISGAIFFHLFTPLGVSVFNADGSRDGGELFALACGVWVSAATLLVLSRDTVMLRRLAGGECVTSAVARGVVAHARGRYFEAAAALGPVRRQLGPIGGSNIQRETFALIFADSLMRARLVNDRPLVTCEYAAERRCA